MDVIDLFEISIYINGDTSQSQISAHQSDGAILAPFIIQLFHIITNVGRQDMVE